MSNKIKIDISGYSERSIDKFSVPPVEIEISVNDIEDFSELLESNGYDIGDVADEEYLSFENVAMFEAEMLFENLKTIVVSRLSAEISNKTITKVMIDSFTNCEGYDMTLFVNRETGEKYSEEDVLKMIQSDNPDDDIDDIDWSNEAYGGDDYYLLENFKLEEAIDNSFEEQDNFNKTNEEGKEEISNNTEFFQGILSEKEILKDELKRLTLLNNKFIEDEEYEEAEIMKRKINNLQDKINYRITN